MLKTSFDSYNLHNTDTLIAGKYKNTLSAVEKLVTEGPSDVLKIKDLGVDFDLNEDGTIRIPEVLRPYMGGMEVIK